MGAPQNYVNVTRRQPDVEDYIDMLRRYRSWVIAPTFAGLVIAVVVAMLWPDTYESRAVMRIVPQAVPQSLVEGISTVSMSQRLEQMEQQILGRSMLMQIIQLPALDLYKKERAHVTLDEVAEKMRLKDIKVRLYDASGGAPTTRGAQAFVITFRYTDRFKAQQVVREITGKFEEYNFDLQRTAATVTNNFVTEELKKAKDRLDSATQALEAFSGQHQGELPQDAALNSSMGRLQDEKAAQEIQLQNLQLAESQAAANVEQSVSTGNVQMRNERVVQFDKLIADATQRLKSIQTLYKDDYPEVVTAKDYLKNLEQQRAEAMKEDEAQQGPAGPTTRTVTNQQAVQTLQQLKAGEKTTSVKIATLDSDIGRQTRHIQQLQAELQQLQGRIAASPAVVQRYSELASEQSRAKEAYDAKSKARDQSETQESLEEHHAGESLDLLEPADLPEVPVEPNRWAIVGLGTFIGLLAGFGMAGAKELKNTSLKNLKDVRAYTNLPVLSSVPLLENALLVRRKRRLAWLAWSSAVVIGGILMCGAAYYHMSGMGGTS